MNGRLEERCKRLIARREYKTCEKEIEEAMAKEPHSAIPHNLMGVLLENKREHVLAMKHFRAACELDPTYVPARYNLEQYGQLFSSGRCAYSEGDCPVEKDRQFEVVYDSGHVGHLVRRG